MKRACITITCVLGLTACPTPEPDPPAPFAVAIDGLDHGVGLAAWSDGDDLLVVGGQLSGAPGQELGGPGIVLRIGADGRACRSLETTNTLWWIHGREPGDWFAVGEGGTILHHLPDATTVDESVTTDAVLYGVWAGDQVTAVGGDPFASKTGQIWRRGDAGEWTQLGDDLPGVAFKVWEDWVVGDGVAWQLDGDTLIEHHPPNGERLLTVRGRGPNDVWAVGGFSSPIVLHWEGDAWSEVEIDLTCLTGGLNGVWTAPGEDVWIAGFFGAAARYDGESWSCADQPLTYEHYHAVWRHDDQNWWVGGNLLKASGSELSLAWTGGAPPNAVLDSCD